MFTFPILQLSFRECCLRREMREQNNLNIEGIQILSEHTASTSPQILYVGTPSAILRVWEAHRPNSATMFLSAGYDACLEPLFCDDGISLSVCRLSLEEACNRAYESFFAFSDWVNKLHSLSCQTKSIQKVLDAAAGKLEAPVFLLSSGYRLVASNVDYAFEHSTIHQLLSAGYLDGEAIDELIGDCLLTAPRDLTNLTIYESLLPTGNYAIFHQLKYHSHTFGRLLVISEHRRKDLALLDYCRILCNIIRENSMITNREEFESDTEFSSLIGDIIDRKISSEGELKNRLFRLPFMPYKKFTCIVVSFEPRKEPVPMGRVSHSLMKIFPNSNIAVYQGELILLVRTPRNHPLEFDQEELQKLLLRFDAYASVGNSSEFISSVRQLYLQTRVSIQLGRVLSSDPEQRIFCYDNYTVYHLIDLCARYGYDFHENCLVYLCTPKYTALKRHDLQNQDNLCEVLEAYIRNNCNTSRTAKSLYLHRNTVINKINRIEELLGESLDNWELQCQLMISAMVLRYSSQYRKEDILHIKKQYSQNPGAPEP